MVLTTLGIKDFIPLILIGVFLDCRVFGQGGLYTTILGGAGILFYVYAVYKYAYYGIIKRKEKYIK